MQRGRIKAVTDVAVLIPCEPKEQDGLATFFTEFAKPKPVRMITDADFKLKSPRLAEALSTMWDDERKQFTAVLALISALQREDKLAIVRARSYVAQALMLRQEGDKQLGIAPAREDDLEFGRALLRVFGLQAGQEREAIQRYGGYRLGPRAEADDNWLLSELMSKALESVRLVLWWSGKQFRPALYCPQTKAAVYTFLLMKIVVGQGWGVCPHCGGFFVKNRSDQNYCTIAHREAHRVARWRAAKASKSKKRGDSSGSHKAR